MQTVIPMLPHFVDDNDQNQNHQVNAPMACYNHSVYYPLHHNNPQMHYSTNLSYQNVQTTQLTIPLPQQPFVDKTTTNEKAQAAIFRLYKDSIATPNSSIFQNECATTDSNNIAPSQLHINAQSQLFLNFNNYCINYLFYFNIIDMCFIYLQCLFKEFAFCIKSFQCQQ